MNPLYILPMLASTGPLNPYKEYLHEIKWDGYRTLAFFGSDYKLQSRGLHDVTLKYPELQPINNILKDREVILDGEIIALNNDGLPDFSLMKGRDKKGLSCPIIYVAFDILKKGNTLFFDVPFIERRKILEQTLGDIKGFPILISQVNKDKDKLSKIVEEKNLEGIISKEINSRYIPGKRTKYWLKDRRVKEGTFLITGLNIKDYTVRSLELAVIYNGELIPVGSAGSGLDRRMHNQLKDLLGLNFYKSPNCFVKVQPRILCRVEYLEMTLDNKLRHPVIKNIIERPDFRDVIVTKGFFKEN